MNLCALKGWMILPTARSETACTTWWPYPWSQPATPPTRIVLTVYTRFVGLCCRVTGTTFLRPLVAYLYLVPPASISYHTLRCVIYLTGLSVCSSLILRANGLFLFPWVYSPQSCCFAPETHTRIWRSHFQIFRQCFFFLYFKGNHARMPPRRKFEVIILSDKYRLSLPVAISLCVWAIVWVSYVNTIMNR